MKPPRLYVVCPCCWRGDLPAKLVERSAPQAPAFTRQSIGLGRARGFRNEHEAAELPEEIRKLLVKRCKQFLKWAAMGEKP